VGELLCECATQHHSIRALAAAVAKWCEWAHSRALSIPPAATAAGPRAAWARWTAAHEKVAAAELRSRCAMRHRCFRALTTAVARLYASAQSELLSVPVAAVQRRTVWARWIAIGERKVAARLLGGRALQHNASRALANAIKRLHVWAHAEGLSVTQAAKVPRAMWARWRAVREKDERARRLVERAVQHCSLNALAIAVGRLHERAASQLQSQVPRAMVRERDVWLKWRAACERVGVGELLCECATQHHSIRALAAAIIRLHAWRGACARKDAVQLLVWCALQRRSVQALATTFDGLHKLARSRAQSMFRATMPRAPMRARHSWARWRAACEKVEASQLLGGCAMQYYSTRALGTAVERLRHHSVQCAIEATTMDRRIMRFHHARTISRGVAALQLCHEASSVRRRLLQRAARCSMRGRLIRGWAVLSARTEMLHRATQHVSRRQLNEGWIALCGGVSSGYSHQKMARNASLHAARRQLRHAWIVLSAHQWGHHLQRRIVALGYAHATRVCSGRLFHSVGRTVRGLYVWRQLTHARLRTRVLMMVVSHAAFRKRCGVALQAWRRDVLLTRREVHAAVSELGRRAWAHVLGTEHIPSLDASFKSA